jgi:hypothetical protein
MNPCAADRFHGQNHQPIAIEAPFAVPSAENSGIHESFGANRTAFGASRMALGAQAS